MDADFRRLRANRDIALQTLATTRAVERTHSIAPLFSIAAQPGIADSHGNPGRIGPTRIKVRVPNFGKKFGGET